MFAKVVPELHALDLILPVVLAGLLVLLASLLKEPARQRFMAIFVAGAGAAYLNGGLGLWEFAFTALATVCAYRGLQSYAFIAIAWLLHTGWDVLHHLYGSPIVFFQPTSSAGCAITDSLIAIWFFLGAPSLFASRDAQLVSPAAAAR
jgi:Family of unknown function (DUF6010)